MNSDPEPPSFFPPLSSLLSGSSRLISLQQAHQTLTPAPTLAADNEALEKFCYDATTFTLLASSPDALPAPSAKSKSDFEARTAPIQVNGSQNGEYDLEQMKKDALELSAQLRVEEVFALRVVVLEWQSRAEEQLLIGGEEGSKAIELQSSVAGKSLTAFAASFNGAAKPAIDFAEDATRRRRQLDIFLKERSSRLKISADLLAHQATRVTQDAPKTWMDDLARQVFNDRLKLDAGASVLDQVFEKCMAALDEQIQLLDDTTKLPKIAQESEEAMFVYAAATFIDIVTILRLLLITLHLRKDISTSNMVLSWFQKLESVNYFLTLPPSPAWPDTTELQCLVAIISFTILTPSATVGRLCQVTSQTTGGVSYPRLNTGEYFEDESCVSELNMILYRTVLNDITILSPTTFAWAIITGPIRDAARLHTETRERMIAEGSSDNESPGRKRASRRDSRDEMSTFEKLWAGLQSFELEPEVREDPVAWFAKYAESSVFGVVAQLSTSVASIYANDFVSATQYIARTQLLQLLREGLPLLFYGDEVLEATLATLTPRIGNDSDSRQPIDMPLAARFIEDATFRQVVLEPALNRYPFELSPMLRLLASLASAYSTVHDIMQLLEGMQNVTIMVPGDFNAYTLVNEEENANEIRIEKDIPLFTSRQALSWYGASASGRKALTVGGAEASPRGLNVMSVPAGTFATVLKETRPMVFKLEHAHSGLEYLGLLLSTRLPNSEMCVDPDQPQSDLASAADIVALISALLTAYLKGPQGEQDAKFVLGRMSNALPDERDIVNVITELMESELLAHLEQTAQEGSLDLLVACAELSALLIQIEPGRMWVALARSSLLGLNGGTNALAAVVGATETALGQFRFLSACTTIFTNLVDDGVGGLIKRRPVEQPVKRRGRFDSPVERNEYTPERTMQRVLTTFTGVMLDAWDSLSGWRFVDPSEKSDIAARMCGGLELVLKATYGLQKPEEDVNADDRKQGRGKGKPQLASVLFPAADAVLAFFAPKDGSLTSMRSFSAALADAEALVRIPASDPEHLAQVKLLEPVAGLLIALLRTSRLVDHEETDEQGRRAYGIAAQLVKLVPELSVLFTAEGSLKRTIAALLAEITTSLHSASDRIDPPSLFGQLSTSSAKAFLSVVSQLDRPLCDLNTERQIWNFLCAVMRGRQQWITLYLVTGTVPRERLGESKPNGDRKSLLTSALAQLSHIEDLAPLRSIALLRFVSAAQGASVWASKEVRQHSSFLKSVVNWVDSLPPLTNTTNIHGQTLRTAGAKKASLICEILARAIHAGTEVSDATVLKMLNGKLNYLAAHGQTVDAYNRSLHLKLTYNFRSKFSGVNIEAFRRSAASPAEVGNGNLSTYDLELMDRALAHEKAWIGTVNYQDGRSNGFREEASRASVNFEFLSAQEGLLRAWSALATAVIEALGAGLTGVDEGVRNQLSKDLAVAVRNSLEANAAADLDVPAMDHVLTMRAEMVFVVLSKLAAAGSTPPTTDTKLVLPSAVRALIASPADFDIATQEEELHYYRLGLQNLVLAVQPHVHSPPKEMARSIGPAKAGAAKATDETPISFLGPATAGTLADVVTRVVAPAWRALAGNLHTNIACALPSDFALVIALLQVVLAVPGIEAVHTRIAEVVASLQLVRSALSLYSWSDQLAAAMDNEPIYGELALQFLQVLSTIRPVAEHIALESSLPILASANLSSYFRKPGGKGPFDEPRRMFTIWTEGMLPLCLNLLDAVGPPVAGDVSVFLNGFPLQLERADIALENRDPTKWNPHAGAVTLGLVQEAHSLCLISMILASDSARAAAEGITTAAPLQGYDHGKVIEDAAGLVRQTASLASRITPANGVEQAWAGRMVDGVESWLSARVFAEVRALARLGVAEGGEGV